MFLNEFFVMDFINLKRTLTSTLQDLMKMAKEITANIYSDNFLFVVNEIKNFERCADGNLESELNSPQTFDEAVLELLSFYNNIYDINLHVYKAIETATIIDIRYYLRTSIDYEHRAKIADVAPMISPKIPLPIDYIKGNKFDVNWRYHL